MFCEIVVYHRKRIDGRRLAELLLKADSGSPLAVEEAYGLSSVYGGQDPYGSLSAHRVGHHCFAILQKTNRNQSTFHVEAEPNISVKTLLESVEDYSRSLRDDLQAVDCPRSYRVSRLVIRPFENDFEESGFEGTLFTRAQAFKDTNFLHEASSKLATFFTTFGLVRLGLTKDTVKAAELSLGIAVLFALIELAVVYLRGHGRIKWQRR
jgi:hypothetical protein